MNRMGVKSCGGREEGGVSQRDCFSWIVDCCRKEDRGGGGSSLDLSTLHLSLTEYMFHTRLDEAIATMNKLG
jgi:hypothetical protein